MTKPNHFQSKAPASLSRCPFIASIHTHTSTLLTVLLTYLLGLCPKSILLWLRWSSVISFFSFECVTPVRQEFIKCEVQVYFLLTVKFVCSVLAFRNLFFFCKNPNQEERCFYCKSSTWFGRRANKLREGTELWIMDNKKQMEKLWVCGQWERGSDESDQEWGLMGQWSWSHLEKTSRGGWSIYSTPEKNGGGDCLNEYAHTQTQICYCE